MNPNGWFERVTRPEGGHALGAHASQLIVIGLAVAIAAQAVLIITDLTRDLRRSATSDGTQRRAPARHGALDVVTLVNSHLFGAVPKSAPAASVNASLVLAGVLATDDPSHGFAILGEAVTSTKLYSVGEQVLGGAKLHAVYSDRVIINRDGSLESLLLPRGAGPLALLHRYVRTADRSADNPEDTPAKPRHFALMDSGRFGEVLKPDPVIEDGKQKGYRLYAGRNLMAFARLGLVSGDVVTSINGTELDDPKRGEAMLRALDSLPEARFTVMRRGREKELVVNLAELTGADGSPRVNNGISN